MTNADEITVTSRLQALLDAGQTFKSPGTLSTEDSSLIKEYAMLPMVLTIMERDRKTIEEAAAAGAKLRYPTVWIDDIERKMGMVTRDLAAIKRELIKRDIKVYLETKDERGIRFMYVHRGYTDRMFFLWEYAKAEVERRMADYYGIDITDPDNRYLR